MWRGWTHLYILCMRNFTGNLSMLDRTEDQKNWPLAAAEDYLTRTYVLPLLANQELREKLIEEHRKNPIGIAGSQGKPGVGHSPELSRVLDKLRRAPMQGKYCRVCTKPHEEWRIGIFSEVWGEPITVLNEVFASEDECEHAVFVKRVEEYLDAFRDS